MLEQRRLDGRLYDAVIKLMPAELPDSGLDEEMLVAAGVAAFNEFYGEVPGVLNQPNKCMSRPASARHA